MILETLNDLYHRILPAYSQGNVIPRGLSYPLDPFLTGYTRFLKRVGSFYPVLVPTTHTSTRAAAYIGNGTLKIHKRVDGMEVGSLLDIGGNETSQIVTVQNEDSDGLPVVTVDALNLDYPEGTDIELYAFPVTVVGATNDPVYDATKEAYGPVVLKSKYRLALGDVMLLHLAEEIHYSLPEYRINALVDNGQDPDGYWEYQAWFSRDPERSFADDEVVHIRAWPAFISEQVRIPRGTQESGTLGPFLLDWVSGMLLTGLDFSEEVHVSLFDVMGNAIAEHTEQYVTKNHPIVRMAVNDSATLFWDVLEGELGYEPGKVICTANSEGRFSIRTELRPNLQQASWSIALHVIDSAVTFTTYAPPGDPTPHALGVGSHSVVLGFGETTASSIMLSFYGEPGARVKLGSWANTRSTVGRMQYSMVVKPEVVREWRGTGMLLKKLFHDIHDIRFMLDDSSLDSGSILAP